MIVFCSDSHTAKGHVGVGNSAQRLIEGGSTAVAVAPADFAESSPNQALGTVVAVSDGDGGARETADSLAAALGATVAPVVNDDAGLVVLDSRAETEPGRVSISSSAGYLVDVARCPVLVLPRGHAIPSAEAPPLRTPPSGLQHAPHDSPARDPAPGAVLPPRAPSSASARRAAQGPPQRTEKSITPPRR